MDETTQLSDSSKEAHEKVKALTDAVTADDEAIAAAEENLNARISALGQMDEGAQTTAESLEALTKAQDDLLQKEAEARASAEKTLDSLVGTFDKADKIRAQSGKKTNANLESQLKMYSDYNAGLKQLEEDGKLSDEVLTKLADGSKESMQVVAGYVAELNKNPEKFAETAEKSNELMTQIEQAKTDTAQTMVDLQTDFDTKKAELETKLSEMNTSYNNFVTGMDKGTDAKANAMKTTQGLIDGLSANFTTYKTWVLKYNGLKLNAPKTTGLPGHAAGLAYVPYDGYVAQLHRGEQVLTALQAQAYRADHAVGYGASMLTSATSNVTNNNSVVNQVTPTIVVQRMEVRDKQDICISSVHEHRRGRSYSIKPYQRAMC